METGGRPAHRKRPETSASQLFFVHDVEGYEHHEIAELLGCSAGTVKSQTSLGLKALRGLLGGSRLVLSGRE